MRSENAYLLPPIFHEVYGTCFTIHLDAGGKEMGKAIPRTEHIYARKTENTPPLRKFNYQA